mmetsp:Transcript_35764/g.102800  ORF Transcript_35764/g.102800 Transcript_35764/m.102800 type:complete len:254 (+) Transcript_35764:92-853(+)
MNYNHDTEMDLDWAADQLRREKNFGSGLPDMPVRRDTSRLTAPQNLTLTCPLGTSRGAPVPADSTMGNALSTLAINAGSPEQCRQICDSLLALLSDRDRVQLHSEFVELKGVEALLDVVRTHGGEPGLSALYVLDKLSRTSARTISKAGGIDIIVHCLVKEGQAPRTMEIALRTLHGLTFDNDAKQQVLRRDVREITESLVENKPWQKGLQGSITDPDEEERTAQAWSDVLSIAARLLQRLGGAGSGQRPRRP